MLSDGPAEGPGGPRAPDGPRSGGTHRTSTSEQGAFAYARCSCGWIGPARRARSRARADAVAHAPDGTG
ncbi:hypothetical protein [Streptomyces synnematoformans]|uniref:Uncharacterized protein n=1 Tax=Streptomyces synnematoformans TaxID=415721 RepID=A0ABP5KHA9_9ACTN